MGNSLALAMTSLVVDLVPEMTQKRSGALFGPAIIKLDPCWGNQPMQMYGKFVNLMDFLLN